MYICFPISHPINPAPTIAIAVAAVDPIKPAPRIAPAPI